MAPEALHPYARIPTLEERRLRVLHKWLTYEGLTSLAVLLSYFPIPIGLLFTVLAGAALLFTPYMIWRLHQTEHHGWIIGFGVTVGTPLVIVLAAAPDGPTRFFFFLVPLAFFYAYTWLLRHSVAEWVRELEWVIADEPPLATRGT